ncbi:MAG: hypothetical protein ACYC6F_18985 [Longimicrobiales bacterium]
MSELKVALGAQLSFEEVYRLVTQGLRERYQQSDHARGQAQTFQFSLRGLIQQRIGDERRDEINRFLKEADRPQVVHDYSVNTEQFFDVTWELVRRGILTPAGRWEGPQRYQFTGEEFRLTEFGLQWIVALPQHDVLPVEHGRFAAELARYTTRFGDGYQTRSQEALSCYRAQLYLACCVMCGAAAEAVALQVAVQRTGDEATVRREYEGRNGTSKLLSRLVHGRDARIRKEVDTFFEILKVWRDLSAHASPFLPDEHEAFLALLILQRFCHFADSNWSALTV